MIAYYELADLFLCASEHEGFCVPLVEAMDADVPIVAYAAGAVPETLGGAGLLFAPKDLEVAAELLGKDEPADAIAALLHGGPFCSAEFDGDVGAIE